MKNKHIVALAAAIFSFGLMSMAVAKGGDTTASVRATQVIPTPTWTAAQEKAYHSRLEAYRRVGHKTPPGETTYICAFCGHKSRQKGSCPKCGFEMGPYDPKAKVKKKVYSSDSM
jgi:hypothetical protein